MRGHARLCFPRNRPVSHLHLNTPPTHLFTPSCSHTKRSPPPHTHPYTHESSPAPLSPFSYLFIAETDHLFLRPMPNLATEHTPAAFHFGYMVADGQASLWGGYKYIDP